MKLLSLCRLHEGNSDKLVVAVDIHRMQSTTIWCLGNCGCLTPRSAAQWPLV